MKKDCVVIGGGIAGLAALYFFQGLSPGPSLLLEARDRTGGNILTEQLDGFLVEGGPDCFLASKHWTLALARKLGVEALMTRPDMNRTFILSGGRLHPIPRGLFLMVPTSFFPLLFSPLITCRGKLRMAMDFFIPPRREKSDESLQSFVERRLGREALEKIAEPLIAGIHASVPDRLSIKSAFPSFVEMEEKHGSLIRGALVRKRSTILPEGLSFFMSFREGLGELTSRLAAGFPPESVRCATKVRSLKAGKEGGYEIATEGGEHLEARTVILATPAYESSRLLEGLDTGLARELSAIPYTSTATVSLGYRESDLSHRLNGYGFVIPRREERRIMACTWTSSKFLHRTPQGHALLRVFLGGTHHGEWTQMDDDEIYRMIGEELRDIMGISATPVLRRLYRWKDAMPQYVVGHQAAMARIDELAVLHKGLYLAGSAYRGIGIGDCIREGEEAAGKAFHYLGQLS
ncbi:MAG: protoporphyrinogen oxidase [Candidatus Eremiobacteraeota bacterium]|nr:protoporphyrinogen oxidase [Candidatus Eremiobacteraeota bacterium]